MCRELSACSLGQHSKVYQCWFIHWSCSVCSRLLNCKFRRHQRSELETILEITRSNSSPLTPISPNGLVTGQDVPDDTQRPRWAKNPACELSSSALSTLCPPRSCSDGHHCSWELRPTTSVSHSSASHICVRDCPSPLDSSLLYVTSQPQGLSNAPSSPGFFNLGNETPGTQPCLL